MLMIKGNDLHVNRLTLEKGEVEIEGRIDSLTYSEIAGYNKQGESFLGRLFK
ncbi:YabP/YqfC family sporulation protein [Gudongella sp. DL1XJH-153]